MARGIDQEGGVEVLFMGNEAIARGALEAGIRWPRVSGDPLFGNHREFRKVAKERNLYVEWSTNEKVALEVAAAASFAG